MKFYLLKAWVRCRRLLGRGRPRDSQPEETRELAQLMRRAAPFAAWNERAHWMVAVAAWLREEKPSWSAEHNTLRHPHRRTRLMLDWLQSNRETRRLVQAAVQKTLREAIGPELFCGPVVPARSSVIGALLRGVGRAILPSTLVPGNLSALLLALFPREKDAAWLRDMDGPTRARLWKLMADDGIGHGLQQQVDEALHFLVSAVVASGVSPAVRLRLGPRLPLRSTPFMALRRELEKFLAAPGNDEGGMRSVRMLLAVCQAQTDQVYEHLDEHGVSVMLVMEIEELRQRLTRMARLIDLRCALADEDAGHALQLFLAETVREHHRSSAGGMVGRSFSLLARKVVERNSGQHEYHIARSRQQYSDILRAGAVGGIVAALAVFGMLAIESTEMAGFFQGLAYSGVLALMLLCIAAVGGVFAARQSPAVAPVIAARVTHFDSLEGMRGLLREMASLLRAQAAASLGNLVMVVAVSLVLALAVHAWSSTLLMSTDWADEVRASLSAWGATPLLAVVTGFACWLASMAAGLADNWFALHRLRDALAHHRGLRLLLGPARASRFAHWCARQVTTLTNAVTLALLLASLPVLGNFFGLPLDIRHGVLSAGMLALALLQLGAASLAEPATALALLGVLLTCVLNVLTPFLCSLLLAMHARHLGARARRAIVRAFGRHLRRVPGSFLLPPAERRPGIAGNRPRSTTTTAPPDQPLGEPPAGPDSHGRTGTH